MDIEIGPNLAGIMPVVAVAVTASLAVTVAGIAYLANHADRIGLAVAEVIDAVRGR